MRDVYLLAGMAIVTFLIRYSLIGMSGRIELSSAIKQLLRYIPAAVLTAIVVPAVLMPDGELLLSYTNARLIGAIAAILISLWTKNLLLTIVLGMLIFFAWQALIH
jgi:branched-subunit amino acid transport protein